MLMWVLVLPFISVMESVKSTILHPFLLFSDVCATAIAHRKHFFVLSEWIHIYEQIISRKEFLSKLPYTNEAKESVIPTPTETWFSWLLPNALMTQVVLCVLFLLELKWNSNIQVTPRQVSGEVCRKTLTW